MISCFDQSVNSPESDIMKLTLGTQRETPSVWFPGDCAALSAEGTGLRMMDSLIIENLRGLSKLEVPNLSQFTLFGGRNGVGKTTVLEAIALYVARLNPNIITQILAARGFWELPIDHRAIWSPFFWNYDISKIISIAPGPLGEFAPLAISLESSYSGVPALPGAQGAAAIQTSQAISPVYALKFEKISEEEKKEQTRMILGQSGLNIEFKYTVFRPFPFAFLPSRIIGNSRDDVLRFGAIDVQNRIEVILKSMTLLEPRLSALSAVAVGNSTIIHGDIGSGTKMPIHYMGDGVARLLSIILAIATSNGGIVLIDEFGFGFHYSIMSKICQAVADAARSNNVQVFATTHSYELLEEAHKGLAGNNEDIFSYFRVDRTEKGSLAKRYNHAELGAAIEQGLEVR